MKSPLKQNRDTAEDATFDMRRPGIVKGTIVPVSRFNMRNFVVAPTSS
jgi:hypothetical protein